MPAGLRAWLQDSRWPASPMPATGGRMHKHLRRARTSLGRLADLFHHDVHLGTTKDSGVKRNYRNTNRRVARRAESPWLGDRALCHYARSCAFLLLSGVRCQTAANLHAEMEGMEQQTNFA